MTIVINEIHLLDGLNRSILLFAADRRITKPDGEYDSTRKKLFKIEYLSGGISYFGLAQVFPNGRKVYLSEWLPNFIRQQSDASDLGEFASRLRDILNRIVPRAILRNQPSGFHIAGYDSQGYPDFYHFSNIGRTENFQYMDLRQEYGRPASHFLGRDALKMGWNGFDPNLVSNGNRVYRNGDIRGHSIAWPQLDKILMTFFQFADFKAPNTIQEYEHFVKSKLEMIAFVYQKFAKKKIIARPIDVFSYSRL